MAEAEATVAALEGRLKAAEERGDQSTADLQKSLAALSADFEGYKASAESTIKDSSAALGGALAELAAIKKALMEEQAAHAKVKSILEALAQEYKDYKDKAEASMAEGSALAEDRRRYVFNPPFTRARSD